MTYPRALLFAILGIGAVVGGLALHNHIVQAKVAKVGPAATTTPYFPAGSEWTKDISNAPLDANSDATIAWLASAGGWGMGRMQVDFSIRAMQTTPTTPMVPFHPGKVFYAKDSDLVETVPLPEGGGFEGHDGYQCPVDEEDCHFLVADRAHGKLYEAWQTAYTEGAISATFIGVWDLNRVYPPSGRGDQCTSADAAGLPITPLLFNADELAVGSINHAIRFILPNPRIRRGVFVHPATHAGAPHGPPDAPAMGARFRLKASYDVSQLTPAAQVVARAMQKYGMFLSDGGNIALTAQSDLDTKAKYKDLDFGSHDLQALKVTDFEVIEGGTPIPLKDNCVRNP